MNEIATNTGEQISAAGGNGQGVQPVGEQPAGSQVVQAGENQGNQGAQPNVEQPSSQPQGQEGQQTEVTVPLNVVEKIRSELQESKASNQSLQNQLNQFQMLRQMGGFNVGTTTQQMPTQTQPAGDGQQQAVNTDELFSGLEDTTLIDAGTMKKIVQNIQSGNPDINKTLEPINATLARIQVQIQDPNYETTIKTYLPEIIATQPFLGEVIRRSPNPLLAALSVARTSPKFVQAQQQQPVNGGGQEQQPTDVLSDLQKIIENSAMPGSPAQMGSGGAVSGNDRFKQMTDAEFDAEIQRVKNGG